MSPSQARQFSIRYKTALKPQGSSLSTRPMTGLAFGLASHRPLRPKPQAFKIFEHLLTAFKQSPDMPLERLRLARLFAMLKRIPIAYRRARSLGAAMLVAALLHGR